MVFLRQMVSWAVTAAQRQNTVLAWYELMVSKPMVSRILPVLWLLSNGFFINFDNMMAFYCGAVLAVL